MAKIQSISGFPEFLPAEQIAFNHAIAVIRKHYERSGAVPIETPAIERSSTLLAKGGDDKEIYGLRRLKADGGDDAKELALHFDLTVPLARYVAQHQRRLIFPFRRYQIQPVWRGERAQAGRYRQFYQCDMDVIGDGSLSLLNDAEMPYVIYQIFRELNIGKFLIRMNNRKILKGFLSGFGLDDGRVQDAINYIDAIEKVGVEKVNANLLNLGISTDAVEEILEFFSQTGSNDEILTFLSQKTGNEVYTTGVSELKQVSMAMKNLGVPEDYFALDLKIARGLDYYTGTIYETKLIDHPNIGSICSGGRYDELTGLFTTRKYPGVGVSIGLTRLLPLLIKAGVIQLPAPTVAPVLITSLQSKHIDSYLSYGALLRAGGINTEIYLEEKKLGAQMKYANKKGFQLVVLAGDDEIEKGVLLIKLMQTGEQIEIPVATMLESISNLLKNKG